MLKRFIWGLLILAIIIAATFIYRTYNQSRVMMANGDEITMQTKKTLASADDTVKITVSGIGDCTLGKDPRLSYARSLNHYYDRYGAAYFFKKVKPVLTDDDLTIANFEGDLTTSNSRVVKAFNFKGPAKYMRILKTGSVEAVSFANNHCRDYGSQGYNDTIKAFKNYQMPYASFNHVAIKKIKGIKIGMIAVSPLMTGLAQAKSQIASGVSKLKKQGAQAIVVSMHSGIEGTHKVNADQKSLAHYAVNHGADLVLGHHPHVLQGMEYYKGVLIAYSLGNFCFGGNSNPRNKETMILRKTLTFKNGQLVKTREAQVVPCSLSGKSNVNNYQPVVLKGSAKKRVLAHMRSYSRGLKIKSSGAVA